MLLVLSFDTSNFLGIEKGREFVKEGGNPRIAAFRLRIALLPVHHLSFFFLGLSYCLCTVIFFCYLFTFCLRVPFVYRRSDCRDRFPVPNTVLVHVVCPSCVLIH